MVMILLILTLGLGVFCILFILRNNSVLKFRLRLIELVSEIDREEINQGLDYTGWRLKEVTSVSYNEMIYKFWRSFESFYTDKKSFKEVKQRQKKALERMN